MTLGSQWLGLLTEVKCDEKGLPHGGQPVRFEFTEGVKPVRVAIGEHFKAIVVPIKHAG